MSQVNSTVTQASAWLYRGVWQVLVRLFHVPSEPPTLPTTSGDSIRSFRPSPNFLRYLKFQFWVGFVFVHLVLLTICVALLLAEPLAGILAAPFELLLMVVPGVIAYVAIHLRFDTTWYVMTDRSLRIRRGIWVIRETTITYENIQNVTVDQGPLQRYFGISDVRVQTAGGGGSASQGHEGAAMLGGHNGLIEGVENAADIRDLVLSHLKRTKSAGLGDEKVLESRRPHGLAAEHLIVLREIRDLVTSS